MRLVSIHRFAIKVALLMLVALGAPACQQHDPDEDGVGVGLTGIDQLADYLSVQEFSVDGHSGAQAGKGGSVVCCVMLPAKWYPGLTVKVKWNITNWRDCTGEEREAVVPVEKYDEVGNMYVHFFQNGKVRVVSSNYPPEGANLPGSQYPIKDPIPQKNPWDVYPPHEHCKKSFE